MDDQYQLMDDTGSLFSGDTFEAVAQEACWRGLADPVNEASYGYTKIRWRDDIYWIRRPSN